MNPEAPAANWMERLWPWLAAAVSGVMLAAAYAPWNQAWLGWVGLGPLLAALWLRRREKPGRGIDFALGWVAGLVYFVGAFQWLRTVTVGGWLALAVYLALYPGIFALLVGRVPARLERWFPGKRVGRFLSSRRNLLTAAVTAICWVAGEWLRQRVLGGFGWNTLGVASHDILGMVQICEIGGVPMLSGIMAFCGAILVVTFVRFLQELGRQKVRPHFDFTITMALIGVCFVHGVNSLREESETHPLRVALVQPNIPQVEKWDVEQGDAILAKLVSLTEVAIPWEPDLTVWPESATPEPFFNHRHTFDTLRELATRVSGGLMLGTLEYTFGPEREPKDFNCAIFFQPGGATFENYRKLYLVPFGEYVPFRNEIPLLDKIVGGRVAGDFQAGTETVIFKMPDTPVRMAPLICFEDTLPRIADRFVKAGANLFVNLTNDAWFLDSAGAAQHFANARLRTVEFRIPMIRCANTGITTIVDTKGVMRQTLRDENGSTFTDGVLMGVVQVPVNPRVTLFARWGDWFGTGCLVLAGLWAATGFKIALWRKRSKAAEIVSTHS